jgi:glycosyltransferase involved in cell wall biosynthesis
VQSLYNLTGLLKDDYEFYCISKDKDIDGSSPENSLTLNEWNLGKNDERIFWTSSLSINKIFQLLRTVRPDVVMINGIFHVTVLLGGLLAARWLDYRVIISPRGMLQVGALAVKPVKKRMFLFFFKLLGLHRNVLWHATDDQERSDILNNFSGSSIVKIAPNITKAPKRIPKMMKSAGMLRMIYLSLVTEKKQLHVALEALRRVETPIVFHIWGPIKDALYWQKCQALMVDQIHDIEYFGSIEPTLVQDILATYDVMILPTMGENFGHAIYESLSVGTPIILSSYTPWGSLQEQKAGITVDSSESNDWALAIFTFIELDNEQYKILSEGAFSLAVNYFDQSDFRAVYKELFD